MATRTLKFEQENSKIATDYGLNKFYPVQLILVIKIRMSILSKEK